MMCKRLYFYGLLSLLFISSCHPTIPPPTPYGPIPTERQLKWQELEMISIVHFGLNTFTDQEWGYGNINPDVFNPTDFNPDQIVSAIKSAGIKGLILVAKHHDGFCLWPTETTPYNISQSPWKAGKGDMVKAFEEACRKQHLAFGIYCSPWDRRSRFYGTPEYLETYRKQLKELYSNYGTLFESWHDGANGGDGYYGGADETRKIDRATYYDWDSTWKITRDMQPDAVIFSDAGWDVRWVGNEYGFAADTTWETFTPKGLEGTQPSPGNVQTNVSPTGTRNGKYWMPAECDVPLRPGWFYHRAEDGKTKSPAQLWNIYIRSVGRAANMNLGIAPDKTGQLSDDDVRILQQFGKMIQGVFANNLAKNASFKASNVRGNNPETFGPQFLVDSSRYSYWATDDSVHLPTLIADLGEPKRFNLIQLRENIKLGQRIGTVAVDQWHNGAWQQIATATGVGANRLIKLSKPVETEKVRLRITDSPVCIALSDFGLFNTPALDSSAK